jgi:E3 ubiquitin-protein ligase SHPRH
MEVDCPPELLRNSNTNTALGILAEEMGLGKTVEMIALISLHKRPQDVYGTSVKSPGELLPSSATLIITPPSILPQWISELQRHSPTLKVFNYKGVKSHPEPDHGQLLDKLRHHDVVFTTYNVLTSEIHYSLPAPDRQLRTEKKYVSPKSPLTQILWWRVCLDEAQMIESGVSNAATVARLIPRVLAWCITGTPVQRDLAGMF